MAVVEGTNGVKEAVGEYDFTVDGGAIGSLTLRAGAGVEGGSVPNGSVILGGYVQVLTAVTSGGAGTVAVTLESAGDTVAAAAVSGAPWSTTGIKSVVESFTGATMVAVTAARPITITIATAALTAGKFRVVLFYR